MRTEFRTYCGLAGDPQELLIARSDSGLESMVLINRTSLFRYILMRRAKKSLLRKLELQTGKKHFEY